MLMSNPSAVLSPTGSPDNASFMSAAPFGVGESSEAGTSAEAKRTGDGFGETLSMYRVSGGLYQRICFGRASSMCRKPAHRF